MAVARVLIGAPTADHWFRIRNSEGVYNVPNDEAERGDASRYSREEADRLLESIGVSVDGDACRPAPQALMDGIRLDGSRLSRTSR